MSFVLAAFYFVKKLTLGLNPPGFATLVVAIFFLAGMQLITIGVMGEYIGRIFDEVKQRPLYVVRRVTGDKTGNWMGKRIRAPALGPLRSQRTPSTTSSAASHPSAPANTAQEHRSAHPTASGQT